MQTNKKGRSNSSFILKKNKMYIIIPILIFIYILLNTYFNIHIDCLFYKFTGLYCPGCGVTRMLKSLLKLDFYQAFRYNQLVFIYLFCYLFYKIIILLSIILKKDNIINYKFSNKFWYILLVITILYGILRNIPMFSYLSPIEL